jgi:signal transduction histidine kinase
MPEPAAASRARPWARLWRSVRVRITVATALVTAVAMVVAGWMVLRAVEDTQTAKLRDEAERSLDVVTARLRSGDDPQAAAEAAGPLGPVRIFDERGETVGAAPVTMVGRQAMAQAIGEPGVDEKLDKVKQEQLNSDLAGTPGQSGDQIVVSQGANSVRLVRTTTAYERVERTVDTPDGHKLRLVAGVPVDEVQRSVDAVRRSLWLGLPVLVSLVAAVAWVLVGRALRPVEAIRREVEAISGSSMHRRVPEPASGDEIGRLARTMNAMLGRLERAAVRQRQFVSDASHELRSPVAAIRTDVEVALREGGTADWPMVGRAVLDEENRLEHLLADLLLLAAGDEVADGGRPPADARVDLGRLAAAETERGRRVPVTVTIGDDPPPPAVAGSADALSRVVANLVDNAARHASTAVAVTVTARADGAGVRLVVDDDGPGIPDEDRERVFERFTRLDDARTRATDNGAGGGAGLGLAVVRSVVTRHHGTVRAEAGPQGGARLVVELPACPGGGGSG